MKPRTFTLTAIAFSLLLGIATIQAQTPKALASIPFDFQVGAQHMSAGRYAVETSDGYLLPLVRAHTYPSASSVWRATVHLQTVGQSHTRLPDRTPHGQRGHFRHRRDELRKSST
jgi:hypothetical protein